jgi:hypothetical protein
MTTFLFVADTVSPRDSESVVASSLPINQLFHVVIYLYSKMRRSSIESCSRASFVDTDKSQLGSVEEKFPKSSSPLQRNATTAHSSNCVWLDLWPVSNKQWLFSIFLDSAGFISQLPLTPSRTLWCWETQHIVTRSYMYGCTACCACYCWR